MTIAFDLPPEIENALRQEGRDPSQAMKEAGLVELYRRRSISRRELGVALGLSRLETEALLKRHDVPLDQTVEELRAELESLGGASGR